MSKYKYYLVEDNWGKPFEIYRGEDVDFSEFDTAGFWRAKKDGSWSDDPKDIRWIYNAELRGDFIPEQEHISEEQAQTLLAQWREGHWPGRE